MSDRQRVREYLERRIRWHSGPGALSSRDELACDARIVEELEDLLDVLEGRPPSRAAGNRPRRSLDRPPVRPDQR